MAIKLKIGPPVIGEDFFGRWNELKKAEVLIQDNNLMLAAPRRVGKTSFARRLKDVQSAKGWNTIFIDYDIDSAVHLFNLEIRVSLNPRHLVFFAPISCQAWCWHFNIGLLDVLLWITIHLWYSTSLRYYWNPYQKQMVASERSRRS